MGMHWLRPVEPTPRATTERERAELLVDVLSLSDALPAPPRVPLDAPPFRELCARD